MVQMQRPWCQLCVMVLVPSPLWFLNVLQPSPHHPRPPSCQCPLLSCRGDSLATLGQTYSRCSVVCAMIHVGPDVMGGPIPSELSEVQGSVCRNEHRSQKPTVFEKRKGSQSHPLWHILVKRESWSSFWKCHLGQHNSRTSHSHEQSK